MSKKTLYNDQFFAGEPGDILYFAASIVEDEVMGGNSEILDLEVGSVGEGLGLSYDVSDADERQEAIRVVRKLTEGFRNLLAKLERRDLRDVRR